MIDEKKLIEAIKARQKTHEKDNEDFKNFVGCDFPEILARVDELDVILKMIEEQPKVAEWIPVEKETPKAGERYLVSGVWISDGYISEPRVYDAVYGSDGKWHGYNYTETAYSVVAWQTLPEAYEPKERIETK